MTVGNARKRLAEVKDVPPSVKRDWQRLEYGGVVFLFCAIGGCDGAAVAVWMGFSVCKAHLERAQRVNSIEWADTPAYVYEQLRSLK